MVDVPSPPAQRQDPQLKRIEKQAEEDQLAALQDRASRATSNLLLNYGAMSALGIGGGGGLGRQPMQPDFVKTGIGFLPAKTFKSLTGMLQMSPAEFLKTYRPGRPLGNDA